MGNVTKEVTIYTDGGAEPNPGPGGYGVILIYGGFRRELVGGFRRTTNNRMEITGAIKGLQALKERCKITLYSDSKYLVESMTKGWVLAWERKGWKRKRDKPVINADLWATLLALCQTHEVYFEWVKGHAGQLENERCDALSMQFLKMKDLPPDEGYENDATQELPTATLPFIPSISNPPNNLLRAKIFEEGQPCRKCQTPVIKRIPRRKAKPGDYYYEYYLYCPGCKTMYMVDKAKRPT